VAAYESYFFEGGKSLRPGERALVACFGNDKEQAKIELDYVRSYYRARTSRMDPTATLVAAFFRVQKDAFVHASLPDKLRPRQLR
jgi:hypothetical protein